MLRLCGSKSSTQATLTIHEDSAEFTTRFSACDFARNWPDTSIHRWCGAWEASARWKRSDKGLNTTLLKSRRKSEVTAVSSKRPRPDVHSHCTSIEATATAFPDNSRSLTHITTQHPLMATPQSLQVKKDGSEPAATSTHATATRAVRPSARFALWLQFLADSRRQGLQ